jgi:hypothetical protein
MTATNGSNAEVQVEHKVVQTAAAKGQQNVKLDTSNLKSSYCNVCNATSTREEVVLNFGINQNWDLAQRDLDISLQHRIILSPHAAKRLQDLLNKLLSEHETRYGELK